MNSYSRCAVHNYLFTLDYTYVTVISINLTIPCLWGNEIYHIIISAGLCISLFLDSFFWISIIFVQLLGYIKQFKFDRRWSNPLPVFVTKVSLFLSIVVSVCLHLSRLHNVIVWWMNASLKCKCPVVTYMHLYVPTYVCLLTILSFNKRKRIYYYYFVFEWNYLHVVFNNSCFG